MKIDRRKFNTPPVRLPALDAETVAAINEVFAKGAKKAWIARQLGVHPKTIGFVTNRKGAYKSVPRFNAGVEPRSEGYNDKRFTTPVVHDYGEEQTECDCVNPTDNDQGICMNCGCWIAYKSKA